MATLRVIVRLERDGLPVRTFPRRREETVAHVETFRLARAVDGGYAPLPTAITGATVFALLPEGDVTLRVAEQTTSNVPIKAGGLFLLHGGLLTGTPDTAATLRALVQTRVEGIYAK